MGKGRKEDSIHANQRTAMAPVFTIPRHPDHDPLLDANAGDVTSFVDHLRGVCLVYPGQRSEFNQDWRRERVHDCRTHRNEGATSLMFPTYHPPISILIINLRFFSSFFFGNASTIPRPFHIHIHHHHQMAAAESKDLFVLNNGDMVDGAGLSDASTVHGAEVFPIINLIGASGCGCGCGCGRENPQSQRAQPRCFQLYIRLRITGEQLSTKR